MERLWAPWRRAFVEGATAHIGEPDQGCFLCHVPASDPAADARNLLVYRGCRSFVILNKYPYNNGHVLIAPYEHTSDFAGLEQDVAADVTLLTQWCVRALAAVYHPDAFNVGMNLGTVAGAGVPGHLHTHVVPRWNGDTNFMPIVGGTKVMSEDLGQTYGRLRGWMDSAAAPHA